MPALIRSGARTLDAATLTERAERAATGFETLGVGSGDAVALFLRRRTKTSIC